MYNISGTYSGYRARPWNRPSEDKIEVLKNGKKLNKKTAAFMYPIFDSSTFRYRGYNIVETLEYSFQWTGAYFEVKEIPVLEKALDVIDVLVVIRCAWDFELGYFIEKAKSMGIRVVYDVDDLIYHPKYMPIIIKTLGLKKGKQWDSWFGLIERNHMITDMCDAFICTNGYLANYIKNDYDKPCYVVRNYMNWMQEEVSQKVLEEKLSQESEKPFIIGYFSGSPTHVKDLMIVMPEIETFLNNHEDARLRIVGYMDLPEEYEYLIRMKKIEFVPFQTFTDLQVEQAKVDINIVPLVNNQFSNCKSELKYFETAIVGTITCATPTYTYSEAITNGDNGYLCQAGEWLSVFEKIYAEGVSTEKKQYICQKALEQYGSKSQLKHLENVFNSIYAGEEK